MGYLDKLKAKADSNAAGELKMLPLIALEPSARNFYRMCEIDQLADSIAANGLEQNLVVKAEPGGKYRIITGHRRYRALLRLMSRGVQVDTVPCIVRPEETDAQEMLRMIASNQYRELSDYEKMLQVEAAADAVKTLRSTKVKELGGIRLDGPTREVISRLTGMSGPAVSKYAGIAEKLIPELKAKMAQNLLPFTVAYAACQYPAEWQRCMTCGTEAISLQDVQGNATVMAVREALTSALSDELDAAASVMENCDRLAGLHARSWRMPGGGLVQTLASGSLSIAVGGVNSLSVEVSIGRFCEIADSVYKRMMTGSWKQDQRRRKQDELPEKMSERKEQPAAAEDVPAAKKNTGAADTGCEGNEVALADEIPVESGQFGRLRDELSGKGAVPDDKALDQLIVWNREKPPEDVYAVVHATLEGTIFEQLAYYSYYGDRWYMDENHWHYLDAQVIGWFKIPKWED